MKEKEEWRDVVGYEGCYLVSNCGSVKSLITNRILKKSIFGNKYHGVQLRKNKKPKSFYVHRLVAQAFIPNPENKRTVNHKNEIRIDNNVGNLEWMTHNENNLYSNVYDRTIMKHRKDWRILQIDHDGNIVKEWDSANEAHRNGYSRYTIARVLNSKTKTHDGFFWGHK